MTMIGPGQLVREIVALDQQQEWREEPTKLLRWLPKPRHESD